MDRNIPLATVHQLDQSVEPFFITEEIEAEMLANGYVFEPPAHISTLRLRDVLATLSDEQLAQWPGEIAQEEVKRRRWHGKQCD